MASFCASRKPGPPVGDLMRRDGDRPQISVPGVMKVWVTEISAVLLEWKEKSKGNWDTGKGSGRLAVFLVVALGEIDVGGY